MAEAQSLPTLYQLGRALVRPSATSEFPNVQVLRVSTMRFFLIAGLLPAIVASAAQAEPVFQRLTGSNQRGDQCFARSYDAAHLQRHPRQRVIRFRLRRDRNVPADVNNPRRFTVAIGF